MVLGMILTFSAFIYLFQPKFSKKIKFLSSQDYEPPLSLGRLNNLLRILQDKELTHSKALNELDLIIFNDINKQASKFQTDKPNKKSIYETFKNEIQTYLNVENSYLITNTNFLDILTSISDNSSFLKPRTVEKLRKIEVTIFESLSSPLIEFVDSDSKFQRIKQNLL